MLLKYKLLFLVSLVTHTALLCAYHRSSFYYSWLLFVQVVNEASFPISGEELMTVVAYVLDICGILCNRKSLKRRKK